MDSWEGHVCLCHLGAKLHGCRVQGRDQGRTKVATDSQWKNFQFWWLPHFGPVDKFELFVSLVVREHRWRDGIAHDYKYMDLAQTSLATRVCSADGALILSTVQATLVNQINSFTAAVNELKLSCHN